MGQDRVRLTVPAKGEYAKAVRMTAAALATRLGMSYDDVDDVRIATEEAFVYACDAMGVSDEVTFEFALGDDRVEISVYLADGLRSVDEEAERRTAYATFILQSVCDSIELSSDERGAYLKAVKCMTARDEDAAPQE